MGRQINFLFFLILAMMLALPAVARVDDFPIDPPAGPLTLQGQLNGFRSSAERQVEISTEAENAAIRALLTSPNRLDPLTRSEALALAANQGREFKATYDLLLAAMKKSADAGDQEMAGQTELQARLRESARESIRKLFAISLRYESRVERIDTWLAHHPKTWFFIGEVIALTGIFVGVDLAMHDLHGTISAFTVAKTTLKSFGVSTIIIGSIIGSAKLAMRGGSRRKFGELYEVFLKTAELGTGLDLSNPDNSSGFMESIYKTLGYPEQFPSCVASLRRVSYK